MLADQDTAEMADLGIDPVHVQGIKQAAYGAHMSCVHLCVA